MNIFERRTNFKPFEYPDMVAFKEAIQHSYWLHSEWSFTSDVQDFKVNLNDVERNAIKNALLAISQIEVSVKRFWVNLGTRFPKPEIEQVGIVFGESEIRHADAYSHLLEVLGLNDEFTQVLENPVIQGRIDYLTKYLKGAADNSHEGYALTLTLFSVFVEFVSLFSQFLVIRSFYQHKGTLKDVDNVVQATQLEENLHALLGVRLLKHIRDENPDWFNADFYAKINRACQKAYDAEIKIVDWIFEKGDLSFLPKSTVVEFIKSRFNDSLTMIGGQPMFDADPTVLAGLKWFEVEVHSDVNTDFFHKKPVTYTKNTRPVKAEDLF